MAAFLIPLIIVVGLVVVGVIGVVAMTRRREAMKGHVAKPDVPTVRHRVPPGQDPAAIAAALSSAGYDAVEYESSEEIVVPYQSEADRARIEQVIREAPGHLPGQ
jgi:hypothetical protein